MRISKVYTRTGDGGETGLGGGQRVGKETRRVEAYGTVDELNSLLGVCSASGLQLEVGRKISRIQNDLFDLGSDLCILEEDKKDLPLPQISTGHVEALERDIDELNAGLEPLREFLLPGGSLTSAHLHVARAVCRRAERLVVALSRVEPIGPATVSYLNRLSDLLFVMARYENKVRGITEPQWKKHTPD